MADISSRRLNRAAGILLHLTSLPGRFGMGDIGPAAHAFARQLARAGQRYWQLLPVNPVHSATHSPYSVLCSMGGNVLLISPEVLAEEGWLSAAALRSFEVPAAAHIDFAAAVAGRQALLRAAFAAFESKPEHPVHHAFDTYCAREAYWLDHFTVFCALRHHYAGKPWQEWEAGHRHTGAELSGAQLHEARFAAWCQFTWQQQWDALRAHCHQLDIRLIGDLPFYMHPESADVWAYPELFKLDADGQPTQLAGVPPDYFNENGQLWGMPVYQWEAMAAGGYAWWIARMRRNLEWFDLVRLDHFRAFSAYWEVEAPATTARNGAWKPGPGAALFDALHKALPAMPFIAEDLGSLDEAAYALRDRYHFPGMRVLQFAFGEDMPDSPHIPFNYTPHTIVYTGTHDNNTTRGWFKQDATPLERKQLIHYAGRNITPRKAPRCLMRLAYASVADLVILPMQDVLELPASARLNYPGSTEGNWTWRMRPGQFNTTIQERLLRWSIRYGRIAASQDIPGQE